MTTVALAGCRTEPLGSYLKALGVLRLVASQTDPAAHGWWEGDVFHIDSSLDADRLTGFLLGGYRPTPVLSPWNRDAGFKEANSTATERLQAIEATTDPRFEPYRTSIATVRRVRRDPSWEHWDKAAQVTVLRNILPDEAIDWIDAAIVLRPEKPTFAALLGAGGNFGRLELSPTFISAVLQVLDPAPKKAEKSRQWLRSALFDHGAPTLTSAPVGQFDPGAAGGLRADAFGSGKPLTNPWDFVLIIEGSLLWTAGVARRGTSESSLASIPFSVAASPTGHGSVTPGERRKAKAELWAPLWGSPLGLPELRRLFAEGRLSWSSHQARTGVDAVRAIRTLGVDAGIDAFVRHLVADRMGQSPIAVPIGRYDVRQAPEVRVLAAVDGWVERLRRAADDPSAPTSLVRAANRVERALFEAASGGAKSRQELLIALADAEAVAGRTERARQSGAIPPVPWLDPREWLPAIDDGTVEFRLAAAIAIAHDGAAVDHRNELARTMLRPIVASRRGDDRYGRLEWRRDDASVIGFGVRPITHVLADLLVARSETTRATGADSAAGDSCPWFVVSFEPRPGDAEALAAGLVDVDRLSDVVAALLLMAPHPPSHPRRWFIDNQCHPIVPAWRVLAPFYARHALKHDGGRIRLRPRNTWARRLVAGDVAAVLADALLRWTQAGLPPIHNRRDVSALAAGVDGQALAASLMVGGTRHDVGAASSHVARPGSTNRHPDVLDDEGAIQ